jgi:hypothetical protein
VDRAAQLVLDERLERLAGGRGHSVRVLHSYPAWG